MYQPLGVLRAAHFYSEYAVYSLPMGETHGDCLAGAGKIDAPKE